MPDKREQMTYASQAVKRTPHEVTDHFIKMVHARIAEVSGWRYVFDRIPALKTLVIKHLARFLAHLVGSGNQSSGSVKRTSLPVVPFTMIFQ